MVGSRAASREIWDEPEISHKNRKLGYIQKFFKKACKTDNGTKPKELPKPKLKKYEQ
jgi:hypothetical protein